MSSIHGISSAGKPLLTCLFSLLLLLLGSADVHGASLRAQRLRGSDSSVHSPPDADMLKALEYIEGLHQRAGLDSPPATGSLRQRVGEAGEPAAKLRLTSDPVRGEDEEQEEGREEKSEELLQAVLSTLQQTEKTPDPSDQHRIRIHKKLPMMFEDEEEEGEGKEEEEEPETNPFKRTNENVEEKYTPQNLATLQSIFDQLDKLTLHKRHDEDQEEEEENNEEEEDTGMFNVRNVAYDNINEDVTDWDPLEEEEEKEEEEESEDKPEVERGLDYMDEDEDEEDERSAVKRSEDQDDMATLVDYYLLKVLEKTEEEEQKREIEEEEQEMKREERRASPTQLNPRILYQILQVSRKYQIPPEDLIDMLRVEDQPSPTSVRKSNQFPPAGNQNWQKKIQTFPFPSRRQPFKPRTPEDQRRDKILHILGLGGPNEAAPVRKQRLHTSSPSRLRPQTLGRAGKPPPTPRRTGYDDQDQLTAYVAAQMMSKYPRPPYSSYRLSQKREEGASSETPQESLDGMDTKRRGSEEEEEEEETMMKLLSYFNPETQETTEEGI